MDVQKKINELRRKLVTALNERRAVPQPRRSLPMPQMPVDTQP